MKRVLITGATGFIGHHTLEPLLRLGYDVHAISSSKNLGKSDNINWHYLDLLKDDSIDQVLKNIHPTHLLHLAWDTTPGKYWNAPSNLLWVKASLTLLESFIAHGGQRIVLAGSCAEYDWDYGVCVEGKTPYSPNSLYGHCKHALRNLAISRCQQQDISIAQGAVFFLFGPHEHPNRFVSQIVNAILKNERTACTEGSQLRDFLYVTDVADAFVALLDSDVEGLVNIASGKPHSLRQIVDTITEFTGNADLIQFGEKPLPSTEPPILLADTTRLSKEVQWHPKYSLEQALKETLTWWEILRGQS